MTDTKTRSTVKALTWRAVGTTSALVISYTLTGNWTVAGSIAVVHLLVNTALYYVHERVWTHVKWGRR